jgi:prepilin-type N-terminal cleavage/methylation domain-containing protein
MKSSLRHTRGFTLVELMAVVAILAVLAIVAVTSYKYYVRRARLSEGKTMLQEIKMKQEQYFSTYSQYVSTASTEGTWYPNGHPAMDSGEADKTRWDWAELNCTTPSTATKGWCDLGFKPNQATYFRFVTIGWDATKGTTTPTSAYTIVSNMDFTRRWHYAVAHADFDLDGTYSTFVVTSQTNAVVTFVEME